MMSEETWGLYVHWPFCVSKCPYCDFNSHVRTSIDAERWGRALLTELHRACQEIAQSKRLVSIFFGGGTPSLMPPFWVGEIIRAARSLGGVAPDLEITLEANPTSAEAERFEAFAQAGVNRLSLGVQAFDAEALRFLGRNHSAAQARQAIAWASRIFPRFSFDLIYALPGQQVAPWRDTLTEALEQYAPQHLSCYQLTYEPGTAFYTRFLRGDLAYPDEALAIALYEETALVLGHAGLRAYEVSNYAVPGQECRHNLVYWRYQDYVGIGPGAHGRVSEEGHKKALQNIKAPERWLEAVERHQRGLISAIPLSSIEQFEEWLLMGLRLEGGLDIRCAGAMTGRPFEAWVSPQTLEALLEEGLISYDHSYLRPSPRGRLVLNQIVRLLSQSVMAG